MERKPKRKRASGEKIDVKVKRKPKEQKELKGKKTKRKKKRKKKHSNTDSLSLRKKQNVIVKKKKPKQPAAQKSTPTLQGASQTNAGASVTAKLQTSQEREWTPQQMQEAHQRAANTLVVKNKENKTVSSMQRSFYHRDYGGGPAGTSGEPLGRTWNEVYMQEKYPQLRPQVGYNGGYSFQSSGPGRFYHGPHNSNAQANNRTFIPGHHTWHNGHSKDYGNRQQGRRFPQPGQRGNPCCPPGVPPRFPPRGAPAQRFPCPAPVRGTLVNPKQSERGRFPQLRPGGGCQIPPGVHSGAPASAPAKAPASVPASAPAKISPRVPPRVTPAKRFTVPVKGSMVNHKQSSGLPKRGPGGSSRRPPNVLPNVPAVVAAAKRPTCPAPVKVMLRDIRAAVGVREPCRAEREAKIKKSMAARQQVETNREQLSGAAAPLQVTSGPTAVSSSGGTSTAAPATTTVKVTQGVIQGKCKVTSTEPTIRNNNKRVRIAHKAKSALVGKEQRLKSTLNKLLSFRGGADPLAEGRRRRLDKGRGRGRPRFGIVFSHPTLCHSGSTEPQETDLPQEADLSQGFHWESIPDIPPVSPSMFPPPPQDTAIPASHTHVQTDSKLEEPDVAPKVESSSNSSHMAPATTAPAPVEEKPKVKCESEGSGIPKKRKHTEDVSISPKEPTTKKKKIETEQDKDQINQLLAVSLREDELSNSLQHLDSSLVQARLAMQVAYAEVQRLGLLRQQFTAEVSTLRAKRIEILQEMKEGYTGPSDSATATDAAASKEPKPSPLPAPVALQTSSNHQPSPTTSAPSISKTPPRVPAVPVKEEPTHITVTQPVTSSTDAPPEPQPAPPPPAHSLSSVPSTATLVPQQEVKEDAKDCGKTTSSRDEPLLIIDSEEELTCDVGKKGATKPLPVKDGGDGVVWVDDDNEGASDFSVKSIESVKPLVIDTGGSECDDLPTKVLHVRPEPPLPQPPSAPPPPPPAVVDLSSVSTQTYQQQEVDRIVIDSSPIKAEKSLVVCVDDDEPTVGEFLSHAGPVHGLQIHEGQLYSCSADNTARSYSLITRECTAVFEGHTDKVNCLLVSSCPNMTARLYTGSSDQTINCYSLKTKRCLERASLEDRVLCLHSAWNVLYAGLADGSVVSYDIKTLKHLNVFDCHGPRGVSCLGTTQEGARPLLLVGSYDSSISVRDARNGLLLRSLDGHSKTVLCMQVVNDLVFSGSSDADVHAHNIHMGKLLRTYKGHTHGITSLIVLGKVMLTASMDQLVRVFELQSHERLQVYGGNSDVVMCMVFHKGLIYTGGYDGSIRAVELNLTKNYRCQWQKCSLVFGIAEHLVQHLVGDHCYGNPQMVTCGWRGCNALLSTQQSVPQSVAEHMQKHVDESEVQL